MSSPATRIRLPQDRASITHNFNVGGHKGIITVGLYPDGRPGEMFITIAKEGSTLSGLIDSFAIMSSMALQHGVPLSKMCEKMIDTCFEPSGWTTNSEIGHAKSLMDYIFRWMKHRFKDGVFVLAVDDDKLLVSKKSDILVSTTQESVVDPNAPPCGTCGMLMRQNGSCYVCSSCGTTSGCS